MPPAVLIDRCQSPGRHGPGSHSAFTDHDSGRARRAQRRPGKELGSIVNLYVTPVEQVGFLLGKQLPYIGLGAVNFCLMALLNNFMVVFKESILIISNKFYKIYIYKFQCTHIYII